MRPRLTASALVVVTCLVACGGSEFSTLDGSGGASGTSGATATGGSGAGATGGFGGAIPDAGSAGGTSTDGSVTGCSTIDDCASAGEYCNQDSSRCESCSDFARLEFGPPERIGAVSDAGGGDNQRFPTPTQNGLELLFVQWPAGQTFEPELLITTNFENPGSEVSLGPPIDMAGENERRPLSTALVQVPNVGPRDFFFDRGPRNGSRTIFAARRTGVSGFTDVVAMPDPINEAGGGSSNYSMALAADAGRVWWMSNRNGNPPELLSISTGGGGGERRIDLTLAGGCPRIGSDATAWVEPMGTFMLFRSVEVDGSCSTMGDSSDLFVAPLASDGRPSAPALPISAVNMPGVTESDPAMSADMCWLNFSSDRGPNFNWDVFRAPRI